MKKFTKMFMIATSIVATLNCGTYTMAKGTNSQIKQVTIAKPKAKKTVHNIKGTLYPFDVVTMFNLKPYNKKQHLILQFICTGSNKVTKELIVGTVFKLDNFKDQPFVICGLTSDGYFDTETKTYKIQNSKIEGIQGATRKLSDDEIKEVVSLIENTPIIDITDIIGKKAVNNIYGTSDCLFHTDMSVEY